MDQAEAFDDYRTVDNFDFTRHQLRHIRSTVRWLRKRGVEVYTDDQTPNSVYLQRYIVLGTARFPGCCRFYSLQHSDCIASAFFHECGHYVSGHKRARSNRERLRKEREAFKAGHKVALQHMGRTPRGAKLLERHVLRDYKQMNIEWQGF